MPQEVVEQIPRALLEVSILLGGAVLVAMVTLRIHVPLTVVLAVAGLLASELGPDLAVAGLLTGEGFKELLVDIFLPILIFEAALGLSTREFMRNLLAIVVLASVALVISTALVGAAPHPRARGSAARRVVVRRAHLGDRPGRRGGGVSRTRCTQAAADVGPGREPSQ